jgi:hypothetical protein
MGARPAYGACTRYFYRLHLPDGKPLSSVRASIGIIDPYLDDYHPVWRRIEGLLYIDNILSPA